MRGNFSYVLYMSVIVIAVFGLIGCTHECPLSSQNETAEPFSVMTRMLFVPETVVLPTDLNVTWRVDATRPVMADRVAIRYDTHSHQGKLGVDVTPQMAGYFLFTTEYARNGTLIPGTFSTTVPVPEGTDALYLRALTEVEGSYYWSDEVEVVIKKQVVPFIRVHIPKEMMPGEEAELEWEVNVLDTRTAELTEMFYDTKSHAGTYLPGVKPRDVAYSFVTRSFSDVAVPGTFRTLMVVPDADNLYARVLVVLDSRNYWTDEIRITLTNVSTIDDMVN